MVVIRKSLSKCALCNDVDVGDEKGCGKSVGTDGFDGYLCAALARLIRLRME